MTQRPGGGSRTQNSETSSCLKPRAGVGAASGRRPCPLVYGVQAPPGEEVGWYTLQVSNQGMLRESKQPPSPPLHSPCSPQESAPRLDLQLLINAPVKEPVQPPYGA